MFNDELWVFCASIFINVKAECKLHLTPIRRACLVESNGIYDRATASRANPEFEVILTNDALLNDREIAAPYGFRETRTPRTCVSQRTRKTEIDCIARQLAVRHNGAAEISTRIESLHLLGRDPFELVQHPLLNRQAS
ncbi:MAG: hypothetical protein OEV03_09660, partial [Gammaproteobacteria bacterium]|nr:hypothetical protein [Gammaproteobacteria bacterium]